MGHYSSECSYGASNYHEKANFVKNKNEESISLLAYKGDQNKEVKSWYLDTGASNHICGDKDMFVELNELITRNVTFDDSSRTLLKRKGKILIRLKNGHELISNVFNVSKMNNNILSSGQLLEKGV